MSTEDNAKTIFSEVDPHKLDDLIAAPLESIINSQRITSKTILDFIYSFCDVDKNTLNEMLKNHKPVPLKSTEFLLNRTTQNENGQMKKENYSISIPLISLFPVPYLGISSAEVDLGFKVIDVVKEEDDAKNTDKGVKGIFTKHQIYTEYSKAKTDSETSTSDISIKITLSQSYYPDGLLKFLGGVSNAIYEKEE